MDPSLLEIVDVSCSVDNGQPLFEDIRISINEGDVVVLQGKSGSGKTTLLKCIAHLLPHEGKVLYRGSTPRMLGVPTYRTKVQYVPQRPSLLPGTPRTFLSAVSALKSRRIPAQKKTEESRDIYHQAIEISREWGIDSDLWDREWSNLSGGEAQRIALAAAVAFGTAEVLLLDEPTSALDPNTSSLVEKYLLNEIHSGRSGLKALVWITHSEEQGRRVGNRFIQLTAGQCTENVLPPA